MDTFRTTTLPLLKKFGIPPESVDLKIESRGVPPLGGGEVVLSISSNVHDTLKVIIIMLLCEMCNSNTHTQMPTVF